MLGLARSRDASSVNTLEAGAVEDEGWVCGRTPLVGTAWETRDG